MTKGFIEKTHTKNTFPKILSSLRPYNKPIQHIQQYAKWRNKTHSSEGCCLGSVCRKAKRDWSNFMGPTLHLPIHLPSVSQSTELSVLAWATLMSWSSVEPSQRKKRKKTCCLGNYIRYIEHHNEVWLSVILSKWIIILLKDNLMAPVLNLS